MSFRLATNSEKEQFDKMAVHPLQTWEWGEFRRESGNEVVRFVNAHKKTIIDSVKKTGRCVIVHEAPKTCGFAAEIIARINERCFFSLEAPIARVTGLDTMIPFGKLENYYLPSEKRILKAVENVMRQ